ncbi:uncharacterized protein LOC111395277 [Olea europaea var. sylvestris]|uniref:uncharacterized protein LOC111395277 n=1 Tax=Olea europaea var. sylvestris TaxID=158386 RepID=UPI000C1CD750|nr:uncharacterized protein LOC111395277 [Olea europaea var. sylvestris]
MNAVTLSPKIASRPGTERMECHAVAQSCYSIIAQIFESPKKWRGDKTTSILAPRNITVAELVLRLKDKFGIVEPRNKIELKFKVPNLNIPPAEIQDDNDLNWYISIHKETALCIISDFCISEIVANGKEESSKQDQKLKTRREIVALGVQLGKMNIAAWASKDEKEKSISGNETVEVDDVRRIEYSKRATAWEEAEKSKHSVRFRRDEIKIQAWESEQKSKLEAEMRKVEAKVEQMRAQAQSKMVEKIALVRHKSEELRTAAEARKNRQEEKTAVQVEYIRATGRILLEEFCE